MELVDQLQSIASRIQKQRAHIQTEEATKNAFVMPFVNALGYDVFNPLEVVPEFTCDVGTKKGEKVDYAIMRDDKPIILVECKTCGRDLNEANYSQLIRYFHVTEARIAVLTNGINYRFYTDLDRTNVMDEKPYLELDMLNIKPHAITELKKLSKAGYDLERALSAATDLKYTKELRSLIESEVSNPSEEFVKLFVKQIYSGRVTQSVKDTFTDLIKKAYSQFINEKIDERLKSALAKSEKQEEEPAGEEVDDGIDPRIETTEEEMEAFHIVRAIMSRRTDPDRIYHRDTVSYFGILLDDNNRKPICRLHFNRSQKYLGLFDEAKNEEKVPIETPRDIYKYEDRLITTVGYYDG